MKKAILITLLVSAVSFVLGMSSLATAQRVQTNTLKSANQRSSTTAPEANLDSLLAPVFAERSKINAEINQRNAELNKLYAQKLPDQNKIDACRNQLRQLMASLDQNMQKERDLRNKFEQMMKANSNVQRSVTGAR